MVLGTALAQQPARPMPGEFVVVDGRVDAGTYAGWKLFHTALLRLPRRRRHGHRRRAEPGRAHRQLHAARLCHQGAQQLPHRADAPTAHPPDREAEREALLELVMKRERQMQGQPLMPAWDADAEVAPHVLDLYAYLNARAAGVLGPGKPKRLPAPRADGRSSAQESRARGPCRLA